MGEERKPGGDRKIGRECGAGGGGDEKGERQRERNAGKAKGGKC